MTKANNSFIPKRILTITPLLAVPFIHTTSHAFEFSYHGMIKPELVNTSSAVASYGTTYSQVAPSNALRTDIFGGQTASEQEVVFLESEATSFQAAHSRFSLNLNHDKVRTILEFDFIDGEDGFSNQTAIQAQGARVRLATIYYDYSDNLTFFGGQKWTTAAGIKSNGSYNWIGNAYRAGNSGFLAMEVGASYKKDGLSVTGAITGKGRNNSSSGINANELGNLPGFAIDVNYKFNGHMVGVAGHTATINFDSEPSYVSGGDQDANFYKIYASVKIAPTVTLNGEYYLGESLNNQNALGVAPAARINSDGTVRQNFGESGFFTFLSWDIKPGHNMKVGYSQAEVDSSDQGRLTITELSRNSTQYINYGFKVLDSLTVFGQLTNFDTEYGVDFEEFSAVETRFGVIFKF